MSMSVTARCCESCWCLALSDHIIKGFSAVNSHNDSLFSTFFFYIPHLSVSLLSQLLLTLEVTVSRCSCPIIGSRQPMWLTSPLTRFLGKRGNFCLQEEEKILGTLMSALVCLVCPLCWVMFVHQKTQWLVDSGRRMWGDALNGEVFKLHSARRFLVGPSQILVCRLFRVHQRF